MFNAGAAAAWDSCPLYGLQQGFRNRSLREFDNICREKPGLATTKHRTGKTAQHLLQTTENQTTDNTAGTAPLSGTRRFA